jgi:ribonuclease BN (tRNA processing enzyme)
LALPPAGAEFAVEEIGAGFTRDEDGMQISAGSLPGGPVPALAYRFEAAGRAVVISGTGWAPADLIAFATGAQTLIHEAAFIPDPEIADQIGLDVAPDLLRREIALHTRLRDVGGLAQQAGVERLILVRLRPPPVFDLQITSEIGESFPRTILIPDDGDEIPFGLVPPLRFHPDPLATLHWTLGLSIDGCSKVRSGGGGYAAAHGSACQKA